ncbi:hypothetical protein D3C77_436250 [compost metagenome]
MSSLHVIEIRPRIPIAINRPGRVSPFPGIKVCRYRLTINRQRIVLQRFHEIPSVVSLHIRKPSRINQKLSSMSNKTNMQQIVMSMSPDHIHMTAIKDKILRFRTPITSHKNITAITQMNRSKIGFLNYYLIKPIIASLAIIPDSFKIQPLISHKLQITTSVQYRSPAQHITNIRPIAIAKHRLMTIRLYKS